MRREINKQKNYDTTNERLKTVLQYNSQIKSVIYAVLPEPKLYI